MNDALIVEVHTTEMEETKNIARQIVEAERPAPYMVRVFFYAPDSVPQRNRATHRVEWTREQGYVQSF